MGMPYAPCIAGQSVLFPSSLVSSQCTHQPPLPLLISWLIAWGEGGLTVHSCGIKWRSIYWLSLLCGTATGSFQKTAPTKTAENTVKHRDDSVDSMVANHRDSVVIITLSRHVRDSTTVELINPQLYNILTPQCENAITYEAGCIASNSSRSITWPVYSATGWFIRRFSDASIVYHKKLSFTSTTKGSQTAHTTV